MMMMQNQNQNFNIMNNSLNNQNSLLSLINSSVLVPEHSHPLIYCNTIDRGNIGTTWRCNLCGGVSDYTGPSFYCMFCEVDMCEKCLLKHKLSDIILYDYRYNTFNDFQPDKTFDWQTKFPFHNHSLTLILKFNKNFFWICNSCGKNYGNNESLYYCSLCNFHLCKNCVFQGVNSNNMQNNQIPENLKYFSGKQLDKMNNNNVENPDYLSSKQLNQMNNQ